MLKSDIFTIHNILLIGFVTVLTLVFKIVVNNVNYEFIDEIFHVSQCQKYCNHVFNDWNPKITTPPGLYFLGYWYLEVIRIFGQDPDNNCSLNQLRSLNFIGGFIVLPVILKLTNYPNAQFPVENLVAFPLLIVYYYLFYTDLWSTILMVFSLVAALGDWFYFSALLSLISVTFRQTNIVWSGFVLALAIDREVVKSYSGNFFQDLQRYVNTLLGNWIKIVPFFINLVLFAIFLTINGGITFGDKENHVAGIHLAQMLYCSMFVCLFSVPIWFSPNFILKYFTSNFGNPKRFIQSLVILITIAFVIDRLTIVHPFLLADNRHYTFYLWRRLIDKTGIFKYLLVFVYHFSIHTIWKLARLSMSSLETYRFSWISLTAFIICVGITIVPSPLFEPRYYILPYLFWRVLIVPVLEPILPSIEFLKNHNTIIRLILEFAYYQLINVIVFFIFVNYTFEWPNEPGVIQRIIW